MRKQKGFAALLIIFILGMVSILVASGLVLTGYNESQMARTGASGISAYYVANSGIEDAIYKLNKIPIFAETSSVTYTLPVDSGAATVTVRPGSSSTERYIDSIGTRGPYVSRIHVQMLYTSLIPGFNYAVWGGEGGVEMDNNTTIVGDVYSNESIKGGTSQKFKVNEDCHNAAQIDGTASASAQITNLNGVGNGACIQKDAYAQLLEWCHINGIPNSTNTPSSDCSSPNAPVPLPTPPEPIPLPDMRLALLKSTVQKNTFTGDCIIGTTVGCYSMISGVATVGDIYITGNLVKPNAMDLNFSGPVYVEGNIDFGSNSTVGLDDSINNGVSQITVAKGKIISAANITYATRTIFGYPKMFLIFISDRDPPSGALCDDPSIELHSNSNSVLFYATQGCAYLTTTSSTSYSGAILGEKVKLINNTTLVYDETLRQAVFGITKAGGWQIASFKQD